ncbi:hypothetical protein FH609_009690 [Streptomyces sp. 3MP-14]|uniref:NERD domain-containing protein n=1 Tax=Streptomyces mimosae TaxID=2586635 RepID=A0A5N6AGR4_9ACTN|nr:MULTISPECIES: hypothetical protein [Streptomyces]KAB8167861.1 hypothetical protein FH607_007730 [Streptomyces mimosae]KAB8177491.1 hypothetical protein FH609_009690 [Streptomyces sp. 3MP-14]
MGEFLLVAFLLLLAAGVVSGPVGKSRRRRHPFRPGGPASFHGPRGRANIDHLVITPAAAVINVDSTMWSARSGNVHERNGRVFHGSVDRTRSVAAARYESSQAALALGQPVATAIAVHGARITGGQITLPGVLIVPAHSLVALLRQIDHATGPASPSAARPLAHRAARLLPPCSDHR